MTCGKCGATIAQVSGKAGGYYGCLGATKGACDNKMLVRRKLAEAIILGEVSEQLDRSKHVRYLLERVEEEVARLYADIPEAVRLREVELGAEERRLANFVNFIGEGGEVKRSRRPWPRPSAGSTRCAGSWTGCIAVVTRCFRPRLRSGLRSA
jgi:hypothetical protein